MTKISRAIALVAALLAALALSVPAFAQDGEARVRVAHLSPGAPDMNVYVDGEPVGALADVPFGSVSSYLTLPAGSHGVEVYATGDTSEPLVEADVDLQADAAYTVGVVGLVKDGSIAAQIYEDDTSPPSDGDAKLRVVHAAPDVVAVDIAPQDGEDLFAHLGFPNASEYAEVPAGTYTMEVTPTGKETVDFAIPDVPLSAGVVYSAFVVGRAGDGSLELLAASDAGTVGGGQPEPAVLPVVGQAGSNPALAGASVPDTGGVSPALLLLAPGLLLALLIGARRGLRHRA